MFQAVLQEMRFFTYTILCFQCISKLFSGSSYEKYLQLFQYLLILIMGVQIILHFVDAFGQEYLQFEEWYAQWDIRCREFEERLYESVDQ